MSRILPGWAASKQQWLVPARVRASANRSICQKEAVMIIWVLFFVVGVLLILSCLLGLRKGGCPLMKDA